MCRMQALFLIYGVINWSLQVHWIGFGTLGPLYVCKLHFVLFVLHARCIIVTWGSGPGKIKA